MVKCCMQFGSNRMLWGDIRTSSHSKQIIEYFSICKVLYQNLGRLSFLWVQNILGAAQHIKANLLRHVRLY